MLSWQQQDQLGRTTLLCSYVPGGDKRALETEISFANGAADHLPKDYRRDRSQDRIQRIASSNRTLAL